MNLNLWSCRAVVALIGLGAVCGCAATGGPAVADSTPAGGIPAIHSGMRLIIKWRDPAFDPSQRDYLESLRQQSGRALQYLRPMSGHAHVLYIEGVVDTEQVQGLINRLRSRPEIESVEVDRRMRHMK